MKKNIRNFLTTLNVIVKSQASTVTLSLKLDQTLLHYHWNRNTLSERNQKYPSKKKNKQQTKKYKNYRKGFDLISISSCVALLFFLICTTEVVAPSNCPSTTDKTLEWKASKAASSIIWIIGCWIIGCCPLDETENLH